MTPSFPMLDPLVYAYVPAARTNESIKNDLAAHCQDILKSHIGHKTEVNHTQLMDLVKRRLLQLSPNGSSVTKFSNLIMRLEDQQVLSRKQEAILFLFTLSSLSTQQATSIPIPILSQPSPTKLIADTAPSDSSASKLESTQPNAARLAKFRAQRGVPHLNESLLVRDTLYLLQGISGKYARFAISQTNEKTLIFSTDPKAVVTPPTQALIHRLAELGYLYSRIDSFVRERENAPGVGMIEQSLCHYLQTQLTEYYRLIAVLETQLSSTRTNDASVMGEETGLSLRRLDVWVNEWRLRMRMMSICVEGAKDSHGGALVNLIHSYTDNGDPFVRKFTHELLEEVSRPFFATLHKWLFSGELYDPFEEFFVTADSSLGHIPYVHPSSLPGGISQLSGDAIFENSNPDSEDISGLRENGKKSWETKYRFRKDMLPLFVGEAFGKKIFSTGKSLNFIRYSCLDSDWVVTREKMSNNGGSLLYGDIAGLERSIDTAYQLASHRLFEVFIDKFKLLDHLSALKNFLLLGHGDFTDQLMETLAPSLARPANTLYRHNLTANLETAIRSSSAQKDSVDVLRRLDARILEYSHGEIGWDVFTLEYKVNDPIDTVLDHEAMEKYLKLFKHLWQMKRIQRALDKGWMRVTGDARNFIHLPELESEWHKVRIVMAEMIHFIRQLEAYCRLEVIECSWKILIDFLNKKEGDLDALIEAHRTYLDRTIKKVHLWHSRPGKEEVLLRQLMEIFGYILQFREAMDNFYNYCLSRSAFKDQAMDAERGVYTGSSKGEVVDSEDALPGLLDRVKEYGTAFSDRVQTLVHHLQVHPDLDCRFLGIRLSFSDFYRPKKELHAGAKS
ncbi:gamma-tubulin complex, DGRIP91/SPC98 component [Gymnopilus junonius]|uniref:Gamma-tubulin complex, DGRIP91/SPC98 component n=1 Tax=Gymnopilus junonius TaxID=109634 RepID=A0A9P5P1F0_GYMJU|nr:gamma-tubulin complex, DGRIP91/SPC98 component [Gymnopilus junonius]